jgi:NitT/TauT family transport system permease protein
MAQQTVEVSSIPIFSDEPLVPTTGQPERATKRARKKSYVGYRIASLLLFIAAWLLSSNTGSTGLDDIPGVAWLPALPGPWDVWRDLRELLISGQFYEELFVTTRRVIFGFGLAFLIGIVVGSAMGLSRRWEAFFELFVVTGVASPGLFVAMITLVALGINDKAAVVGIAIISSPTIVVTFWQASKALDRDLDEMGRAFSYNRSDRVRHLILPQLLPPSLAATRYGLGLAWKLVVLMELLGLSNGVGYQVNFSFQLFNLAGVMAWTIGFLLFVLVVEYALVRPTEARLSHWRDNSTKRKASVVRRVIARRT